MVVVKYTDMLGCSISRSSSELYLASPSPWPHDGGVTTHPSEFSLHSDKVSQVFFKAPTRSEVSINNLSHIVRFKSSYGNANK